MRNIVKALNVTETTIRIGDLEFRPLNPVMVYMNSTLYTDADTYSQWLSALAENNGGVIEDGPLRCYDFSGSVMAALDAINHAATMRARIRLIHMDSYTPGFHWFAMACEVIKDGFKDLINTFDWDLATKGKLQVFSDMALANAALSLCDIDMVILALQDLEPEPNQNEFLTGARINLFIELFESIKAGL